MAAVYCNKSKMISGSFGSGKSIVALITIQNHLKANPDVPAYFIVFDELSSLDVIVEQKYQHRNFKVYNRSHFAEKYNHDCNSVLMSGILQSLLQETLKKTDKNDLLVVFDEYDGEYLTQEEAEQVIRILTRNPGLTLTLLCNPTTVQKTVKSSNQQQETTEGFQYEVLEEHMNRFKLKTAIRNSTSIYDLLAYLYENADKLASEAHFKCGGTTQTYLQNIPQVLKNEKSLPVTQVSIKENEESTQLVKPKIKPKLDIDDIEVAKDGDGLVETKFAYPKSKKPAHNLNFDDPVIYMASNRHISGITVIYNALKKTLQTHKDEVLVILCEDKESMHYVEQFLKNNFKGKHLLHKHTRWEHLDGIQKRKLKIAKILSEEDSTQIILTDNRCFRGLECRNGLVIVDVSNQRKAYVTIESFSRVTSCLHIAAIGMHCERASQLVHLIYGLEAASIGTKIELVGNETIEKEQSLPDYLDIDIYQYQSQRKELTIEEIFPQIKVDDELSLSGEY